MPVVLGVSELANNNNKEGLVLVLVVELEVAELGGITIVHWVYHLEQEVVP